MKLVEACLSGRKTREGSFHLCRGAVNLMRACLSAGMVRETTV